jgi:MYXO-CTERM domain-containing protein
MGLVGGTGGTTFTGGTGGATGAAPRKKSGCAAVGGGGSGPDRAWPMALALLSALALVLRRRRG